MAEATDLSQNAEFPPIELTRTIPYPLSISEPARAMLAMMAQRPPDAPWPAQDDIAGWEATVAAQDEILLAFLSAGAEGAIAGVEIGGVPCHDLPAPEEAAHQQDFICLHMHGGAMLFGGGQVGALMADQFRKRIGLRTINIDYRMPPHFPYPAAPDDCLTVYRALIETVPAEKIILLGASAGGNLAAVTALRARDEGLPSPKALILLTPEADLTESGDSFSTLAGLDPVLAARLPVVNRLYAGEADLATPYISPLFADFSKGFPPCLIQSGTRDLFLSNAVLLHRALRRHSVSAELHIFEAMPHGGFGGYTAEDAEMINEIKRFIAALP